MKKTFFKHSNFGPSFVAACLCIVLMNCTGKRVKEQPIPEATPSGAQGSAASGKVAGSLAPNSLAMLIIAKLKANIKAKADLSDSLVESIGNAAEKKIVASQPKPLNLVQESSGGALTDFIDDLAEGALESLGEPSFAELELSKVQDVLKTIVQTTLQGLKGNAGSLSLDAKKTMLTDIMKKIVGALDNAGFDNTEIADAVEISLETAVANLDEAEILTDSNAADLIGALIKGAVMGSIRSTSTTSGLNLRATNFLFKDRMVADEEESTAEDTGEETGEEEVSGEEDPADETKDSDGDGVIDSLESDESDNPEEVEVGELPPDPDFAELDGFDPGSPMDGDSSDEEVAAAMYFSMLTGTVGSLNDAGFGIDKILILTPITIRSLLETLGTVGMSQKAIEAYLSFAIRGAIEGLAQSGLTTPVDLSRAVAQVSAGAVQSLKALGFAEDKFDRLLGVIVKTAVSQIDDLKLIPKADFGQTCAIILAETTESLKAIGITKDNKNQLLRLVATIISAAVSELDDLGLSDDESIEFISSATGATFGSLDDLGFAAEDLAPLGTELQSILKESLVKINKDLFGDLDYSELDFDAESDVPEVE